MTRANTKEIFWKPLGVNTRQHLQQGADLLLEIPIFTVASWYEATVKYNWPLAYACSAACIFAMGSVHFLKGPKAYELRAFRGDCGDANDEKTPG